MKRSLRRHIERAINATWPRRGEVTVALLFPDTAFPDAPTWHPGPGFETTVENHAWRRDNNDGTTTAVVTNVGPKQHPSLTGGTWTDPEVWTVTAPSCHIVMDSGALWDKPHRITWTLDDPQAVIHRQPYQTHPTATVHAYWQAFENTWGFQPRIFEYGTPAFGEGRRWIALTCQPGWANLTGEDDLLEAAVTICRRFGAKARVYPWSPSLRGIPVREDIVCLDNVVRRLIA